MAVKRILNKQNCVLLTALLLFCWILVNLHGFKFTWNWRSCSRRSKTNPHFQCDRTESNIYQSTWSVTVWLESNFHLWPSLSAMTTLLRWPPLYICPLFWRTVYAVTLVSTSLQRPPLCNCPFFGEQSMQWPLFKPLYSSHLGLSPRWLFRREVQL